MNRNKYIINKNDASQRLDKFLLKYFNKATKSFIYKMLRKKRIKLNGKKAEGNEILNVSDEITFYISPDTMSSFMEEKEIKADKADISVIYEDENIILINKDCGVIVHPDKNNDTNTLSDMLLLYLKNKGEFDTSKNSTFTPSICNRLDRNTSGIITAAKNLQSAQALNKAFRDNEVDKYYMTVVSGNLDKSGIIKGYHVKNTKNNAVKIYDSFVENSSEVITEYQPIKIKNGFTLVKIKLITGKSHQIRASFQHLGFPLAGDKKYGCKNDFFTEKFGLKNQLLHCCEIHFTQENTVLEYLKGKTFYADSCGIFKKCFDYFIENKGEI